MYACLRRRRWLSPEMKIERWQLMKNFAVAMVLMTEMNRTLF